MSIQNIPIQNLSLNQTHLPFFTIRPEGLFDDNEGVSESNSSDHTIEDSFADCI